MSIFISCSGMEIIDSHIQHNGKIVSPTSILFKLIYNPIKAKRHIRFYTKIINNFKRHIQELRIANSSSECYAGPPINHIRLIMVTEDLIPLEHEIEHLVNCIESHNLYRINYMNQEYVPRNSSRIRIINFIIKSLKNIETKLSNEQIENYQLLINHITQFAIKAGHDALVSHNQSWIHQHDPAILTALTVISNKDHAPILATLLNEETLNKENLEKQWEKYLENRKEHKK